MLTRGCCPVAVVGSAAGGGVQEVWSDRTYEWDQLVYDFNFNGPRQRMWMVRHSSSVQLFSSTLAPRGGGRAWPCNKLL